MPYRYYLAHPWDSREQIRKLELDLEEKLAGRVDFFNPFYDMERKEVQLIDTGQADRYHADPEMVVTRDLKAIGESNGLLGVINGGFSIGTIMEIVYANVYMKPVILLVTNGHEEHYWLRYHAEQIFITPESLELWLNAIHTN